MSLFVLLTVLFFWGSPNMDCFAIGAYKSDEDTVLLMHFDEEGDEAKDSSGHGYEGEIVGATWTDSGKFGGALYFIPGTYVNIGKLKQFKATDSYTLEAWVKKEDSANISGSIIGNNANSGAFDGPLLDYHEIAGIRFIYVGMNGSSLEAYASQPADTLWHHIAGVKSGDSLKIYIDGKNATAGTNSGNPNNADDHGWMIGARDSSNPGWYFTGTIDEVRISNIACYTDDFIPLGSLVSKDNKLSSFKLLHHFDRIDDGLVTDSGPGGINFELKDIKLRDGYLNKSISFLKDSRVKSFPQEFNLGTNDFTFSVCLNTLSKTGTIFENQSGMIMSLDPEGTGKVYYGLWLGSHFYKILSTDSINDGQWHKVDIRVNRNGKMRIYIDGAPNSQPLDISADRDIMLNNKNSIMIGSDSTNKNVYIGLIDELSISIGEIEETPDIKRNITSLYMDGFTRKNGRWAEQGDFPFIKDSFVDPTTDLVDFEIEIKIAKEAGIDAFSYDTYPDMNILSRIKDLVGRAKKYDFAILPIVEISGIDFAPAKPFYTVDNMVQYVKAYVDVLKTSPSSVTVDGAYLFATSYANRLLPGKWREIFDTLSSAGYKVKFLYHDNGADPPEDYIKAGFNGFFSFFVTEGSVGEYKAIRKKLDFINHEKKRYFMGSVINNYWRVEGGIGLYSPGTTRLRALMEAHSSQRVLDYLNVSSWNDYSESHQFMNSLYSGKLPLALIKYFVYKDFKPEQVPPLENKVQLYFCYPKVIRIGQFLPIEVINIPSNVPDYKLEVTILNQSGAEIKRFSPIQVISRKYSVEVLKFPTIEAGNNDFIMVRAELTDQNTGQLLYKKEVDWINLQNAVIRSRINYSKKLIEIPYRLIDIKSEIGEPADKGYFVYGDDRNISLDIPLDASKVELFRNANEYIAALYPAEYDFLSEDNIYRLDLYNMYVSSSPAWGSKASGDIYIQDGQFLQTTKRPYYGETGGIFNFTEQTSTHLHFDNIIPEPVMYRPRISWVFIRGSPSSKITLSYKAAGVSKSIVSSLGEIINHKIQVHEQIANDAIDPIFYLHAMKYPGISYDKEKRRLTVNLSIISPSDSEQSIYHQSYPSDFYYFRIWKNNTNPDAVNDDYLDTMPIMAVKKDEPKVTIMAFDENSQKPFSALSRKSDAILLDFAFTQPQHTSHILYDRSGYGLDAWLGSVINHVGFNCEPYRPERDPGYAIVKNEKALLFNGDTTFAVLPMGFMPTGPFRLSIRLLLNKIGSEQTIISDYHDIGVVSGENTYHYVGNFGLYITDDGKIKALKCENSGWAKSVTITELISDKFLELNVWTDIELIYDKVNMSIYINGKPSGVIPCVKEGASSLTIIGASVAQYFAMPTTTTKHFNGAISKFQMSVFK